MNLKKILIPVLTLLSFQLVAQDWRPGYYMQQALENTMEKAIYVENNTYMGFPDGICILGVYLETGEHVNWGAYLETGKEYAFIGGGDGDASDIDICIFDEQGNEIECDTESDPDPVVLFTPKRSGEYTIRLKLYSCDASGSFLSMAVMAENANSVPSHIAEDAINEIIEYGGLVNDQVPVKFHDIDNQWCLFGAILESGESETIVNMDLGSEGHVFIAAGDDNLSDADLFLYDSYGNELEKDVDPDAIPVIQYDTKGSATYKLTIKNESSDGRSLVFTSILTQ